MRVPYQLQCVNRWFRARKLLAAGLLAVLSVFGWMAIGQTANAQSFRSGNNATVPAGQIVDSSLFVSGRTIDIAGTVNGDVFCAGQNITITGTVNGDVICAGQTVRISGTVDGNVRVVGQNVLVGGSVARNLSVAGQQISSEANSQVGGDATVAGQDVTLNGQIDRDLALTSDTATLNGVVGRSVQGNLMQLTLGSSVAIRGNLVYTSPQDAKREAGAQVVGQATRNAPKPDDRGAQSNAKRTAAIFIVWLFGSVLLLSMVLVLLMPQIFQSVSSSALRHVGMTVLLGLVSTIVMPFIILILFATLVGIPLGLLLLLAWGVLLLLSGPFSAYLLGRLLLRSRTKNALGIMLLGSVVLLAVYLIPVVGQLTVVVAVWLGLGMQLAEIRRIVRARRKIVVRSSEKTGFATKE